VRVAAASGCVAEDPLLHLVADAKRPTVALYFGSGTCGVEDFLHLFIEMAGVQRISVYLRFSEEAAASTGITPQQHQGLLAIKGWYAC
jgi:hypothetical protein